MQWQRQLVGHHTRVHGTADHDQPRSADDSGCHHDRAHPDARARNHPECDGAAGSINHTLTTAEQNPGGDWTVTLQPFGHNFTTVDLHPVQTITVLDGPGIQHEYGDITSCAQALFP